MREKYIGRYCRSALDHYEFANADLANIKGYEYYGALAQNINKHGIDAFVNFLADLQIWGTPDQVYEQMMDHQRMVDAGGESQSRPFRRESAAAAQGPGCGRTHRRRRDTARRCNGVN
jgi:hypothetical protein